MAFTTYIKFSVIGEQKAGQTMRFLAIFLIVTPGVNGHRSEFAFFHIPSAPGHHLRLHGSSDFFWGKWVWEGVVGLPGGRCNTCERAQHSRQINAGKMRFN